MENESSLFEKQIYDDILSFIFSSVEEELRAPFQFVNKRWNNVYRSNYGLKPSNILFYFAAKKHGYSSLLSTSSKSLNRSFFAPIHIGDENLTSFRITILDPADIDAKPIYKEERENFRKSGPAFVLMYSIVDRSSIDPLFEIRRRILRMKEELKEKGRQVILFLVATKTDLSDHRQVSTQEGLALANHWGVPYIEMSSKEEEDMESLRTIARMCVYRQNSYQGPYNVKSCSVMLEGKMGVGKSSFVLRALDSNHHENWDPSLQAGYNVFLTARGVVTDPNQKKEGCVLS